MSDQNTLGLDDDFDGIELVEALRAAFGVAFSDKDAEGCYTVGDLYRVLLKGFDSDQSADQGCAGAMAFYRIRQACRAMGMTGKLSPGSALTDLAGSSLKKLFGALESRTGLDLPRLDAGPLGIAGGLLVGLGVVAVFGVFWIKHSISILALFSLFGGFLLSRVDRKRLPKRLRTMGDLSKAAAALNFGNLVLAGARPREKDVWDALTELLAMNSTLAKAEIRRETVLLGSQLSKV